MERRTSAVEHHAVSAAYPDRDRIGASLTLVGCGALSSTKVRSFRVQPSPYTGPIMRFSWERRHDAILQLLIVSPGSTVALGK